MNSGVPDALAELVLALMARDRDDRPKTAADVLAALDAIDVSADAAKPAGAPRAHAAKATLVLVLPFDAGGDAYLAQAVTDAVIDALSTSRGLRVFARGAAASYAGKEPREAGAELGADAVVHGSIERVGDDLRVQARVVGVADGLLLRSVRFTRANGDLLSAGGDVARNVAAALDVDAAPKPLGARDPQIVDLYVRARHDYFAGSDRSLTLFKQALDRAPDDPLVLAGYALARVGMRVTPSDLAETARIAARAVELAPDLAEAHLAAGHLALHQGRATEAARAIRRALDIAPSNGDAHLMIGRLFGECSALVPAMTHIEIACRIDPTLAGSTMELARLRALLGAWKEVDALVEKLRPAPLLYWQCVIRFALWRNDEATLGAALAAVRAGELRNHTLVQSVVRFVDGSSLEIAAPDATARRIVFGHQLSAEVASLRGRHDDALEHIDRAANAGLFDLAWLDHCAALVPVRANRRFSVARHAVAARVEEILEALG
jgi:TolB-like protein